MDALDLLSKLGAAAIGGAALIAASQVPSCAHYPTDVARWRSNRARRRGSDQRRVGGRGNGPMKRRLAARALSWLNAAAPFPS